MIRHILFDLDSTLYSARYGLEDSFAVRLKEYTVSWLVDSLNLSAEECERLREEGYKRHGTTLAWLCNEMGFTAVDEYLAYVHPENEADSLLPDPELRRFLETLPCPCSILTNSPLFHADRIIKKLGLEGIFQRIFDITYNKGKGKPNASAYFVALDVFGLTPAEALFIDDLPHYVQGFLAIGGRGILLDEMGVHGDYPHERIGSLRELTRFLE